MDSNAPPGLRVFNGVREERLLLKVFLGLLAEYLLKVTLTECYLIKHGIIY